MFLLRTRQGTTEPTRSGPLAAYEVCIVLCSFCTFLDRRWRQGRERQTKLSPFENPHGMFHRAAHRKVGIVEHLALDAVRDELVLAVSQQF